MKKTIQIEILEILRNISIRCPFSPKNNEAYKALHGQYEKTPKRWLVPDNADSRSKLNELFGAASPSVVVSITPKDLIVCGSQVQLSGYVAASWDERKNCVHLPEGVDLVAGGWDQAASAASKTPCLSGPDAVLHVVVRRDYAESHDLKIVEELVDEPVSNPLAQYADSDLRTELEKRGYGIVERALF